MPADIGREEVLRLLGEGAKLVEVLPQAEYDEEHLPGAIHLPLKKLDAHSASKLLQRDRPIIVYCFDLQ